VIYDEVATVHVSGHANQEELKLMLNLTRPEWVIPVHGEPRHLYAYTRMAEEMGFGDRIRTMENGDVLEFKSGTAEVIDHVTAGVVLVDGIGLGDIDDVVLRDRAHLSQDGILVVVVSIDKETGEVLAGPELISRGFVYEQEAELLEEAKEKVLEVLSDIPRDGTLEWSAVKLDVRRALNKFVSGRTGRRPMVMPVIQEI
jgi:ribonuclease J